MELLSNRQSICFCFWGFGLEIAAAQGKDPSPKNKGGGSKVRGSKSPFSSILLLLLLLLPEKAPSSIQSRAIPANHPCRVSENGWREGRRVPILRLRLCEGDETQLGHKTPPPPSCILCTVRSSTVRLHIPLMPYRRVRLLHIKKSHRPHTCTYVHKYVCVRVLTPVPLASKFYSVAGNMKPKPASPLFLMPSLPVYEYSSYGLHCCLLQLLSFSAVGNEKEAVGTVGLAGLSADSQRSF